MDQANEIHSGVLPEATSGFNSSIKVLSFKWKTLTEVEVATANQNLFGEKAKALISSPTSKVNKRVLEAKSHNWIEPSLPPEAQRDPSGEMVMLEM